EVPTSNPTSPSIDRAAALDSSEPTGKSPGRGRKSVAGKRPPGPRESLELRMVCDLLTVVRCCVQFSSRARRSPFLVGARVAGQAVAGSRLRGTEVHRPFPQVG